MLKSADTLFFSQLREGSNRSPPDFISIDPDKPVGWKGAKHLNAGGRPLKIKEVHEREREREREGLQQHLIETTTTIQQQG